MRAQLRTYHAIPCLQLQQDPNAYKQLQDAPRLKSILKGACEEKNEPSTIEKLRTTPVPRTNPVNLVFVLSQYAPKLTELHFNRHLDFFDLVTRTTLSSQSRARCFLWLMWWYLESDFSAEAALKNPFGPGEPPEVDGVLQKVGPFDHLTEQQASAENVDTQEEIDYGLKKQEERKRKSLIDLPSCTTLTCFRQGSSRAMQLRLRLFRNAARKVCYARLPLRSGSMHSVLKGSSIRKFDLRL